MIHEKKPIYIFISTLILAAFLIILPAKAFAADGQITRVEITVPLPAAGKTPDTSGVICSAYSGSDPVDNVFFSALWYRIDGQSLAKMSNTDTFLAANTYQLGDAKIYSHDNEFDENVIVLLNGLETDCSPQQSSGLSVSTDVQYSLPSFQMNGHGEMPDVEFDAQGMIQKPDDPTDAEWSFQGWFLDSELKTSVTFPYKASADTVLYAKWIRVIKKVELTVHEPKFLPDSDKALGAEYTVEGGNDTTIMTFTETRYKGTSTEQQISKEWDVMYGYNYSVTVEIVLKEPEKYVFDKTATEFIVNGDNNVLSKIEFINPDRIQYAAVFRLEDKPVTVTFDYTGGPLTGSTKFGILAHETIAEPVLPEYDTNGWRFDGWFSDLGYSNRWDFSKGITDDLTLYSKWTELRRVTIHYNGAKEDCTLYVPKGSTLDAYPDVTDIPDCIFYDFYTDKGMKNRFSMHLDSIDKDIDLYVHYSRYITDADIRLQIPVEGEIPNADFYVSACVPAGLMTKHANGKWRCSDNGQNYRDMQPDECFSAGKFYSYTDMLTKLEDKSAPGGTDHTQLREYFSLKVNGQPFAADNYQFHNYFIDKQVFCSFDIAFSIPSNVSFDMLGNGVQIPPQTVEAGGYAQEPDAPESYGYEFTGWYTSADLNELFDFSKPVNGNTVVYAGWKSVTEEINADFDLPWLHFNADSTAPTITGDHNAKYLSTKITWYKLLNGMDWTVMDDGEEFIAGYSYRAEFTVFENKDHPFTDDVSVTVCGSADGVKHISDAAGNIKITYTKKLEYSTHTVSFEMRGHGAQVLPQTVEEGLCITKPDDPSAEGYVFKGWYSDNGCTVPYDFSKQVVKDCTAYALWCVSVYKVEITVPDLVIYEKPPERVNLSTEKGTQALSGNTLAVTIQPTVKPFPFSIWSIFGLLEPGQSYCIPSMDIRVNSPAYCFAESVTVESNLGTATILSSDEQKITISLEFIMETDGMAGLTMLYCVSFDTQGHGTAPDSLAVKEGQTFTKPADPKDDGYTFGGWYVDEGLTKQYDFNSAVNGDIRLFAKWTKNTVSPVPSPAPTEPSSPAAPSNRQQSNNSSGYQKDTLSKDILSDDTGNDKTPEKKTNTGSFSVTFEMNGHGEQIKDQSIVNGGKAAKPADPSAEGFTFGGWYTDNELTEEFDFDDAITSNTRLYAKWTADAAEPTAPETEDRGHALWWVIIPILGGALLAMIIILLTKRKKSDR